MPFLNQRSNIVERGAPTTCGRLQSDPAVDTQHSGHHDLGVNLDLQGA
jgi:hypothetical protein